MVFQVRPRLLRLPAVILVLVGSCTRADRSPQADARQSSSPSSDSLALAGRHGIEIWYSISRPATGTGGSQCVERGLQIRRGGERIQVPLLYTGDTPTLINDSTMRATLWTNCRPVATYLVDLRTGRPVRHSEPGQR
jgi:hypothetical protein